MCWLEMGRLRHKPLLLKRPRLLLVLLFLLSQRSLCSLHTSRRFLRAALARQHPGCRAASSLLMPVLARKHLHPVIAAVGHYDVTRGIHGHAAWFLQLAVAAAALPQLDMSVCRPGVVLSSENVTSLPRQIWATLIRRGIVLSDRNDIT